MREKSRDSCDFFLLRFFFFFFFFFWLLIPLIPQHLIPQLLLWKKYIFPVFSPKKGLSFWVIQNTSNLYVFIPAGNYMFKVNNRNTRTTSDVLLFLLLTFNIFNNFVWNMLKVNNKNAKARSMMSMVFLSSPLNIFHTFFYCFYCWV